MEDNQDIDYYDLKALLTEDEKRKKTEVRDFVEKECMPIIVEHFENGAFPLQLIPRMAELGLFGVHVKGYGCHPLSHRVYGLICQELGRCDSGLRAMFSVQNSLVMFPIDAFGSEEQKEKWLPKMAQGDIIGCFGLSEPDYGSDPAGMTTTAEKKQNSYVLNGKKMWITNSPIAHLAVVWAKLENEIGGFLVEKDSPGLEITAIKGKFSYRTSPTGVLAFRNCRIPQEALLPKALGLKSIFQCLNLARYGVACGAAGSAIACYESAKAFSLKRQVFRKPIASYQLVQEKLVHMVVEITKAQLLNDHLGRLMDDNRLKHPQISLAKLNNVREAMKIARLARDIMGARGILASNHVIRHLCDLEAISTLEGTESVHTLALGQDLTGISAFL